MDGSTASAVHGAGATSTPLAEGGFLAPPQLALLDFFFPGFSVFSTAVQKYLHIDLNLYIPLVLLCGGLTFAWRYLSEYVWGLMETHLMSTVDLRNDDETYNWLMAWVAAQNFAQRSRRFVVNSNLNSRSWFLWWDNYDDENEEDEEGTERKAKKRPLQYTPTFGSHFFWFKGRLLIFRRTQNNQQGSYLVVSEREEISVACFGRNPWVLKELLLEARDLYTKRDEQKTVIFRGTTKGGSTEPTWQRCMARTARPFSTVILNEDVKKKLIDDVTDYLNPNTRRWYANRGIPYRRGYLLYGPPGTGKSSLSLALAGFFKMRIYIVSLSSVTANEENLSSLFAELPRRCVVLLEDIDTAGLTHTREDKGNTNGDSAPATDMVPGQITPGQPPANPNATGRLSLSGLLNILDGVASQEGRVLIMTTNHIEKLDKALIRPGRVDMSVKFDKADDGMNAAMFRAIFAPLEGDEDDNAIKEVKIKALIDPEAETKRLEEEKRKRAEVTAKVERLADEFAAKIPAHEFSPAEIQGFLLKNKRDPEGVVAGADKWVEETRKEKKEKELKEAEDKRKAEEEEKKKKEEEEKKKKEEEEKKKKEEEEEKQKKAKEEKKERKKNAKRKSKSKSRKSKKDDSDSDSSDSDSSSSESEAEAKPSSKSKKAAKDKDAKEKDAKEKDADAAVVVVEPPKKPEEIKVVEVQVEKPVDSPLTKELMADEVKHGGDSGYGTP